MKEKWRQFNKWRQDRFLKNWSRTRERGKLYFVIKFVFFWTAWMTLFTVVWDKYFSRVKTNLIVSVIVLSVVGIFLGQFEWGESEKKYQLLIASTKAQE